MSPLTRINRIGLCATAAFVVLAAASPSALAEQPLTNLGPVGPHEPILVSVGTTRVIAYYTPGRGTCAVNAIVWKEGDEDASNSPTRVRLELKPGEMFALDGSQRHSMNLLCGADAASLAAVVPADLVMAGGTD